MDDIIPNELESGWFWYNFTLTDGMYHNLTITLTENHEWNPLGVPEEDIIASETNFTFNVVDPDTYTIIEPTSGGGNSQSFYWVLDGEYHLVVRPNGYMGYYQISLSYMETPP